jgi:hypothetical protein
MAGEGYGTTSINTGSAQVVGSPTFNIEKYAQPFIAKRKEDAVKAAAKAKSQERILGDIGKIKTTYSEKWQPFIEQGKKDVLEKTQKALLTDDIYDKMALNDAKLKLNTMIDGAKKTDALYGGIGQQMLGGGNYWNKEHFDDYHKPLQTDDLSFDNFLKLATEDANKATQIRKDTYNPIKFNDDMNATARTFYGTQGNFTEQDLRDTLETMFTKDLGTDDPYHFDTYQHYVMDAKKLPDLQTKYKGDIPKAAIDLAVNDFIQLTGLKPKGKGSNFNFNFGGEDTGTGVSDVARQTFDMNLTSPNASGGVSPVTLSFDADGFTFTPVDASRAVPSNTFTLDGKPYTKQGIVNMSIGSVLDMPIATKPINVGGRVFAAGQPIPKQYLSLMNKEPNKYKDAIGFKKMATAVIDDADQVAFDLNEVENIISTNQKWGQKGYPKYKDNQKKLNSKLLFKDDYPALFGGSVTSQPSVKTTGGTKTTSGKKTKAGAIDLSDF